jgi:hypothetical protein
MSPPHTEVLLVGAYALFLLLAGRLLERTAGHIHRRAEHWRTGGFTYHHHLDAWECTQGQQLWPTQVDHELRVIRYRAKAPVCNACPIKSDCTDADDGRELTVALDPWPHSEAGRFHRGISLVLVVLAATFIVIEAARHHTAGDLTVLTGVAAAVAAAGRWALHAFRASPANFPEAGDAPGLAPRRTGGRRDPGGPGWAPRTTWTTARPARVRRWDHTRSHRQGP